MERLDYSFYDVRVAYVLAWHYRPTRSEPLWELARFCREKGYPKLAEEYEAKARPIRRPNDQLFVNESAYRHHEEAAQ